MASLKLSAGGVSVDASDDKATAAELLPVVLAGLSAAAQLADTMPEPAPANGLRTDRRGEQLPRAYGKRFGFAPVKTEQSTALENR